MSVWRLTVLSLALVISACSEPASEQGFAGLAATDTEAADFLQPGPGDRLQFPEDFGPHPQHRIEWWYLTANLETADGEPLGLQWTQFRQALKPRPAEEPRPPASDWPLEAAWMAHGAVSYQGEHVFAEKLARGDVGQAGAIASPLRVWLDDWQLTADPDNDRWRLKVRGQDWHYDLWLSNTHDRVAHGDQGFSAKSASGEGSMYFSLVDLQIEGTVTLGDSTHAVSGQGWFDREWSSQFLKAGQQGWDWFALHLADNYKLMAFRLREGEEDFLYASWITPEREVQALGSGELEIVPVGWRQTARGRVPVDWEIRIPGKDVSLAVTTPSGDYWNLGQFPYWESPVRVTGSHQGRGYMELTGYGP